MTAHTPILNGYSLHTIDWIVRTGIHKNAWYAAADADERYACAWHNVVEEIMTAEECPHPTDLIRIAWRTADELTTRTMEQRGHGRARGDAYTGRTDMPKWHAYWETVSRHTASPEDMTVDEDGARADLAADPRPPAGGAACAGRARRLPGRRGRARAEVPHVL